MILITGGTGFLGSNIVSKLKKKDIRILSRRGVKGYESIQGDITAYKKVEKATKGCETVFHLAAAVDYTLPKEELDKINVTGTKNVMEAAKRYGARVIYASTAAINDNTKYSRSKKDAEKVVLSYPEVKTVIVRPAPMYGVGSRQFTELFDFISSGKLGIIKDDYSTHLLSVEKCAEAFLLAEKRGKPGEIYTVADKEPIAATRLYDIICRGLNVEKKKTPFWLVYSYALFSETMQKLSGKRARITRDYLDVLLRDRKYDISKAVKELGYKPVSTETGMKKMVKWYRSTRQIS